MSKIFYDHLVVFEEIDLEIKRSVKVSEEKEELWKLIDEIVHHHVIITILDKLPREHHMDFLEKYHSFPHDTGLIDYLNEKISEDIEKVISEKIRGLEKEILEIIRAE